jgi:hypothetical protein
MSGSGYDAVVDVDDEVRCALSKLYSPTYMPILACWQIQCFTLADLS